MEPMTVLFILAAVVAIIFAVAYELARLDREMWEKRWQQLHWEKMHGDMTDPYRHDHLRLQWAEERHRQDIRRIHQEHGTQIRKLHEELLRAEAKK